MKPRAILICVLMILAMTAVTAWVYPSLPPIMPTHWNFAGHVDGYGARWQVWLIGPVMMSGLLLLGMVLPWISPKQYAPQASGTTYGYLIAVPVALMGCIELFMLCTALGMRLDMARAMPALISVMLILMGNPMGKVRRNFFMGIRTPWTLASERVWYATHRMAARLMVGSGVLGLCAVWLAAPHWMLLVLMMAWAPLAAGYSLLLYKRLPQ